MKRIFIVLLLTVFAFSYAQTDNRFSDSEEHATEVETSNSGPVIPDPQEEDPGAPGELPIDNYIPILLLTAVGIIIYKNYKKKTIV